MYHTFNHGVLLPSGPDTIGRFTVVQCLTIFILVELIGIEPTTYSLRTNRSPKLSYSPNS